ncbi:hypothetical protein Tco_1065573 [Tanacetum coccineum]
MNAVKKIFKYLKGQPKLGLWYPRDSPFVLEAYSDSDYAGSHGDRKSTTGGCQFLGRRLISWQCKKQTIVATSSTEAEYVAAANCCGQVLWIQNQMLDYGCIIHEGGLALFKSSTALDLDADDRSFIRVLSDDDYDSDDDPVIFWSAFATWEVVPTLLGDINALYMMDRSSKYFTHLREILHLVDRQDLLKLYGMVVKYYEDHPLAGAGMMLWGDLQVLFESHEGGHGSLVWSDQQQWHIRSWRLFPFSNVHVLETISGKVVYMFADGSYPLSVQLMKKMLKHKLEIEIDGVGNDMTYAEQLIQFIKNQIAASIPSA